MRFLGAEFGWGCGFWGLDLKKRSLFGSVYFFGEVSWGYVSFWAGVIPFCDCEFFELGLFHSAIANFLG